MLLGLEVSIDLNNGKLCRCMHVGYDSKLALKPDDN